MLCHPTDRTLYLIEWADLEADRPLDVVRDNAAILSRIVTWARKYLCEPNAYLGRTGAVCPFVETSIKRGYFYLTVCSDQRVTAQSVSDRLSRYSDWFPELEPRSGSGAQFKTILNLFPQPDVIGVSKIMESVRARLKASFVARGLMIGEFHPGPPEQPGLWNSEFRPLASPIPLLGIRYMVPSDFPFLQNDGTLVLEYVKRFGNDVPEHLREKVHEAARRFGVHV
jgi:uncharacterized protein DUF6875